MWIHPIILLFIHSRSSSIVFIVGIHDDDSLYSNNECHSVVLFSSSGFLHFGWQFSFLLNVKDFVVFSFNVLVVLFLLFWICFAGCRVNFYFYIDQCIYGIVQSQVNCKYYKCYSIFSFLSFKSTFEHDDTQRTINLNSVAKISNDRWN